MEVTLNYASVLAGIPSGITVLAVSKNQSIEKIKALYEAGQRDFGENKVQELVDKQRELPLDIRWHLIGLLQTNKVKYIAPFVHLIQSVDSLHLIAEINKQGMKTKRIIDCLLQVYIANENTKFGLDENEIVQLFCDDKLKEYSHVRVIGMMGMASNTKNEEQVLLEFGKLYQLYMRFKTTTETQFSVLSMGMSGDYLLGIQSGSTMVRLGSILFGER